MPLSKDELCAKLDGAGISYTKHEHPAVATADAQAQHLSGQPGSVTKNLFLKDKKNRLYIITALPATKIDLKAISARLGLGKGGLSMAPEALLADVLQVPLGSVTPLAVFNPEASAVSVLLDGRIQSQDAVYVHPMVNTTSLGMSASALAAALALATGKSAPFVDLELEPQIDQQNLPDLRDYVPQAAASGGGGAAAAAPEAAAAPAASDKSGGKKGGKEDKNKASASSGAAAAAAAAGGGSYVVHAAITDTAVRAQDIVDKACAALTGKPPAAGAAQPQLDDGYALQRLRADVEMQLNALKNAAFAMGYAAAKGSVVGGVQRLYA